MMGDAISGLLVLGSVRRWDEQAVGSKPVSSSHPRSLHHLLPPGSFPSFSSCPDSFGDELQF